MLVYRVKKDHLSKWYVWMVSWMVTAVMNCWIEVTLIDMYFDSESYWFLIEIKKVSQSSLQAFKGWICLFCWGFFAFFFSKKRLFKDEEFHCIANKGKTAKNEWANNDSDFV